MFAWEKSSVSAAPDSADEVNTAVDINLSSIRNMIDDLSTNFYIFSDGNLNLCNSTLDGKLSSILRPHLERRNSTGST